jgi:hypothetical protein
MNLPGRLKLVIQMPRFFGGNPISEEFKGGWLKNVNQCAKNV